ncbi:hypothetical protein [Arthrobacter sp. ISL-72]|uniref:hypothetical protein n=1 Tax=Arthrobacter sp. ISL-72 TaxID=2819114 RepID=UPI001BE56D6B|nr:hypothetical protein [Arthrobacter sp. ISL-72]MBT2597218.1 hypothetical protein [Arthrobacter sp. ISL-72]
MRSASDPDRGRGRDQERDDATAPLGQGGTGTPDSVKDGFYEESDGLLPYREEPGYFDDAGAPVEGFFPEDAVAAIRETVVAREEERFGGIKIGSAFFGWLTTAAMAVLLAALVMAAGNAGFLTGTDLIKEPGRTSSPAGGMTGTIVLLMIPFLAFLSGGYVAGRMARFNGIGQGLMVWLWAAIVAAAFALLAIISGGRFNVLTTLNSFLRLPMDEGPLSTSGIIVAIAVAAIALVGAVLGGMAGVHYHRKVDRAGFTPTDDYYQP